jgi:hypothetical protein
MINSPFGANLTSSLLQNQGLHLNPITSALVGTSQTVSSYTPGTLITGTVLNDLTNAINAGYNTLGVHLDTATYANLISIGSTTIPALGNSLPPTYTWIGPVNSGNPTSTAAQDVSWYPYTATATTNTYPFTAPTPRQWSDLTSTNYTPDITQWGWIRLFALQAWYEFNYNNDPADSTVSYKEFLFSFQTCSSFLDSNNPTINTITNSQTFLQNTYSNNNDLMTGDITGVNLATYEFGKDLIALGKVIDLTTISSFGLPSNLLKTIQKYNALTQSLSYALISSGLSTNDIETILKGKTQPTKLQEQQLYGAYTVIVGKDLLDILIPLNCSTKGLTSLIDLLNPQKLFPNSYPSLTVPVYNSGPGPTNAKTYYPIYVGTNTNSQISNAVISNIIGTVGPTPPSGTPSNLGTNFQLPPIGFGSYTRGIIPDDVSVASGAFSYSMQQITNIQNIPIEKFAQVVLNLETNQGLPLTAGTNVPANTELTSGVLDQIAYGSGPNGTYTMSDFFGCMTGLPYQWTDIKKSIIQLQTSNLATIYHNIYTTITTASTDVSASVQTLINSANAEIANIQKNNPSVARDLNRMWNLSGTQLTTEQRARDIALAPVPVPKSNQIGNFPQTVISYVSSLESYSKRTEPHMYAQTIEAITDTCSTQGQSQVALMRSVRNQEKLLKAGIPVSSSIPTTQNLLTTKILMGNGTVSTAKQGQGVPAGNATFTIPADPNVLSYNCSLNDGSNSVNPIGYYNPISNCYSVPDSMSSTSVLGNIPYNAEVGQDFAGPNLTQVNNPINPIAGFKPNNNGQCLNLGRPSVPGSLASSPYQNLIQPQLSVPFTSGTLTTPTYSVPDAIHQVIECNCDCWLS